MMVQWALACLSRYPIWPVQITLTTNQRAAYEMLTSYGFVERHTLLTMRRRVR